MAAKSVIVGLYDFAEVLPDMYTIEAGAVYGDKTFFVSEDVRVGSCGIANLALTLLPSIDLTTGSVRFKSSSTDIHRPLVDGTGLAEYDFKLDWVDRKSAEQDGGPTLFTAIEKLGLKSERRKVPLPAIALIAWRNSPERGKHLQGKVLREI
jgi:hypothetical protein